MLHVNLTKLDMERIRFFLGKLKIILRNSHFMLLNGENYREEFLF